MINLGFFGCGQGREPVAVIDIGSNSVRLVVYEAATRSPTPLFNEKVLCGLGGTLASTGKLSEKSVTRALNTLRRFRAIADQLGAKTIKVVATAAAREAENGPSFIARAEKICGTEIAVLSGEREAQLAAAGVIAGLHDVDGIAADLGGGSLEVIDIKSQALVGGVTLPLGALRLMDHSKSDLRKAKDFVAEQIESVDWLKRGRGRPFYAVGGTWRAFARLHMVQTNYPLSVIHGYRISTEEAVKFARLLSNLSTSSLAQIKVISKSRRDTIPYGALVMESLLRRLKPSQLVVSAFGVREGLLYTLLPEEEKQRDPLIAACEELAQLRSRSAEHARELVAWTARLFDDETDEEKRLREAGCLLSDIGWRAHPDYRGEQSLNFVAHAAFAGIDHPGRAFLALSVFYRNQGILSPEPNPFLRQLVDKKALKRARILGAAIRAAHMLSAAMPGVIPHTPVSCEPGKLVLQIPDRFAALEGERLERRFRILAEQMDLEPVIKVGAEAQKLAG